MPENDIVELAKCCSSCAFSLFNHSYNGKKQKGMCMVLTEGEVPKYSDVNPYYMPCYLTDILKNGKDSFGNTKVPTEDEYVKIGLSAFKNKEYKNQRQITIETLAKAEQEIRKHYTDVMTNYHWWQENFPKVRFIHRENTCGCWIVGKGKASIAKGIAKKYSEANSTENSHNK